jgi:WD40 repeat protein
MKKILFTLILTTINIYANIVTPTLSIEVNGTTKDMVLRGKELIIGTDNGILEVYNYEDKNFTKRIILEKIEDFIGDKISPILFSVDKIEKTYLLLSESGTGGYANLWIGKEHKLTQLLTEKEKQPAIKARFIDKNHILLGLLSNEAVLFDIEHKKEIYRVQLNESKFSDFALNEDKSQAVFSCESGTLTIIQTKTGKILKNLKGLNLDNVYKVDFKKNTISGAGQDRRGSLYNIATGKGTHIKGSFLIYATALSPSSKKVAFAMDEQNNISIYNRQTQSKIAELQGEKSRLNNIIFKDENLLFSSSDDSTIFMWKLK